MEKKEYKAPGLKVLDVRSRYGLLDGITVSNGTISDGGDIGFSKDADFDDDESIGVGSSVWDD
ncbi:MAG: hypothetical protein J5954_05155 [Prevotella sp.]|nr:hypothetical protein [Prevotella sp.]MBP3789043.1 hypothetical protein [Prevotella sp.]